MCGERVFYVVTPVVGLFGPAGNAAGGNGAAGVDGKAAAVTPDTVIVYTAASARFP